MTDYGNNLELVRGSQWPPGEQSKAIKLTRSSGWTSGEDTWTWELLFSRSLSGGTPDLAVEAYSVTSDSTTLTLLFKLTEEDTAALPGGTKQKFYVDLRSTDGSGNVSIWDEAQGYIRVRDAAGQG